MFKNEDIIIPPSNTQDVDLLSLNQDDLLTHGVNEFSIDRLLLTYNGDSEETLDVADLKCVQFIEFTPTSPRGPPERKNISERCNFRVEIDGSHTQKKKFLYSHLLNRIFIEMGCNFSVNFNWDMEKVPQRDMFIRATVVFSDPEQQQKRVERCLQHAHSSSNAETTDEAVIKNVLRSARDLGDPNVYYCGNPTESDSWYSVLVRLNRPTGHAYKFVCKNSCSSGINRRHIDIIFTLEDSDGAVYGRQNVGARACSCPRRDLKQQEQELQAAGGKRALANRTRAEVERPTKKIKLEVVDSGEDEIINLSHINIVGARTTLTGLRVCYSMMQLSLNKKKSLHQPTEDLEASLASLKNFIDKLENEYKV